MIFTFTNEQSDTKADQIIDHLKGPRLWIASKDYPDYEIWLTKVHKQLKRQEKRALLALDRGTLVGAVVYQLKDSETLELKNISVSPESCGRYIASFLLRNVEVESLADYPQVTKVVVDTKESNLEMCSFLQKNGYTSSLTTDLYGLSAGSDVVFSKELRV